MATFSPVLRAVFFADPADKLQNVLDISPDYEVMSEILKVLFHVNRKFGLSNHEIYSFEMLKKMYKFENHFEIDVIQQLCKQQMLEVDCVQGLSLAISFDCVEEKSKILENMTCKEISTFFHNNSTDQDEIFSAKEVSGILRKINLAVIHKVSCTNCCISNQGWWGK